jgi:hypothetical protein
MALTGAHVSLAVSYSSEKCFVGTPKVVTRADSNIVEGVSNDRDTLSKPNIREQPWSDRNGKVFVSHHCCYWNMGAVNVQG